VELLEWDAATYDSLPLPHVRWGAGVIERLGLVGEERVIDLGCGTGRDTAELLDRYPDCTVVAVDGSQQMLAKLRERLGTHADRVEVVYTDLTTDFPAAVHGDAAMSVATFHWIRDHRSLFARVAAALAPQGRFEAEFGGAGNITGFRAAFERAGGPAAEDPWEFAGTAQTVQELQAAGFCDIDVRTVADPVVLERGEQLEAFIATVLLPAALRNLPADRARALVTATAAQLPDPVIDYVRVQLSATRS
jgi:trans-aconitate 2-methyltransferase